MSSVEVEKDIIPPIFAWLKREHPSVPAILDRPNVLRPKLPYFTVAMVTPIQRVGSRDSRIQLSDTTWIIGGQRRFTLSIRSHVSPKHKNFYEAQNLLIKLQDSLQDENRRSDLSSAGLAVWFSTDILDVSELLETGYEPRAQFDIEFGIASNRETDLGAIEKVKIQGTLDGETQPEFDVPDES